MFRVIPVLLVDKNEACINTNRFHKRQYLGDPVNITRIFSEKAVDELIVLNIDHQPTPNYGLIQELATECFMPLTYGGNLNSLQQCRKLINLGVEKLAIGTARAKMAFVEQAASEFGSQALVGIINYSEKEDDVHKHSDFIATSVDDLAETAKNLAGMGFGEILLYNNSRDGTRKGYDLASLKEVSNATNLPIIALGGAKNYNDILQAKASGAEGGAASTLFVNYGKLDAVLITYPKPADIFL